MGVYSVGSNRVTSQYSNQKTRFASLLPIFVLAIGSLLIIAALTKFAELTTAVLFGGGLNSFQLILVTIAVLEIVLALKLCFAADRRSTARLTIILFCVFLVFNSALYFNGQSHCACFGDFKLPILYSIVFDVVVLLMLVLNYGAISKLEIFDLSASSRSGILVPLVAGALFPAALLSLAAFSPPTFGSLAALTGNSLQLQDHNIEFYYKPDENQDLRFQVPIENRSSANNRIVGYAIDGTACAASFQVEGLPLELGPFEKKTFDVLFSAKEVTDPEYWSEIAAKVADPGCRFKKQALIRIALIPEQRQKHDLTVVAKLKLDESSINRYFSRNGRLDLCDGRECNE